MRTAWLDKRLLLILFKEFVTPYNPNSLAKRVGKSRVGVLKALRKLAEEGIVESRRLGRANFYALNDEEPRTRKRVELLLMEEASRKRRWLEEFKELFPHVHVLILYGSILNEEEKANDIDLLLVLDQEENEVVNRIIKEKSTLLPRRIHPLKQTKEDLIGNLRNRNPTLLDALKKGLVLHGAEELVELIRLVGSEK